MSEEANAENASDTVASALRELAAVAGLDDWHLTHDWALKGGGEFHIPPQLSELDTWPRAPSPQRTGASVPFPQPLKCAF